MTRVVFDCMVFIQALARPNGPAAACFSHVTDGKCELIISDKVLKEIHEVVNRPKLRRTFIRATDEDIETFFLRLAIITTRIDPVPDVFVLTRDQKDSKYLNLAIAAGAKLIVSRDNDLLDLMTDTDNDAMTFRKSFPGISILDPIEFLKSFESTPP